MPGQYPSFVRASLWQMPEACTRMRTWPASGWGISRSTTWYGPLALTTWAARILGIDLPPELIMDQGRASGHAPIGVFDQPLSTSRARATIRARGRAGRGVTAGSGDAAGAFGFSRASRPPIATSNPFRMAWRRGGRPGTYT